ncbi:hypothetical protein L6164_008460 [Bauhinia variegata]|uniref:Uncharacterized protein n=1 Tax=Bauhinia variegata TaxID=167791 RepID=A0ACB9PFN9_BAUVA|nr:hypothetical protein L6164_008460 [Bauhinia variegata]
MKNPHILLLSVSLPTPPPETTFLAGLPFGAIEAIKAAYGVFVQILDPPRDGFNLTLKLNLSKLPQNQEVHVRTSICVYLVSEHEKLSEVSETVYGIIYPYRKAVMAEARSQQAASMTEFHWLGHRFPISNAKTRVAILKGW